MRLPLLTAAIALLHSGAAAQGQGVPEISLGPIEAKLLYKATGRLSDNLLGESEEAFLLNAVIGEVAAEEPSDDVVVLVPLQSEGEQFAEEPVDLWAEDAEGNVIARRSFDTVATSGVGDEYKALLLQDVTCAGTIRLHAEFRYYKRSATLNFECGE